MCLSHLYSHFFLLIIDTDKWNGVNTRSSAGQLVYKGFINNILIIYWYFLVDLGKLTVYNEHNIPRHSVLFQ